MIAQLCNSHGFFHGWLPTQYHHEVFRAVVTQIEEHYTGNCIVIDDTWLTKIATEESFVAMYPNVMRENIEHIFFVSLVDEPSYNISKDQEIIQQLTTAKHRHQIGDKSKFSFWAYFCQQEFWKNYKDCDLPWTGDKVFLSYNRKPASHRTKLVCMLNNNDIFDRGHVTMGCLDPTNAVTIAENTNIESADIDGDVGVPNDIRTLGNHQIWQDSFINVVTETVTHGNFLSEKIWKPIIGKRPFMLVGPPGGLQQLRDWGFKTFNGFWDENYQLGKEDAQVDAIVKFLVEMADYESVTLKLLYHEMASILDHNHKHFFETFAMENRARIDTIVQDEMNG